MKRKDLLLLANVLIEQVPDPHNAKEHYESFLKKKNRKSVKQSIINQKLINLIKNLPLISQKLSTLLI